MKENAKRRSRRAQEAHPVQGTNAVDESALPPELAIFAWLLDPARRETMRRRFIDGKGGPMERWIWKFAYSRPLAPEHGIVGMRFMTVDQNFRGEGAKPGPKYLNLPPGAVDRSGRPDGEAGISWESLAARLPRAAGAPGPGPHYHDPPPRPGRGGDAPRMARPPREITEEDAAESAA